MGFFCQPSKGMNHQPSSTAGHPWWTRWHLRLDRWWSLGKQSGVARCHLSYQAKGGTCGGKDAPSKTIKDDRFGKTPKWWGKYVREIWDPPAIFQGNRGEGDFLFHLARTVGWKVWGGGLLTWVVGWVGWFSRVSSISPFFRWCLIWVGGRALSFFFEDTKWANEMVARGAWIDLFFFCEFFSWEDHGMVRPHCRIGSVKSVDRPTYLNMIRLMEEILHQLIWRISHHLFIGIGFYAFPFDAQTITKIKW